MTKENYLPGENSAKVGREYVWAVFESVQSQEAEAYYNKVMT